MGNRGFTLLGLLLILVVLSATAALGAMLFLDLTVSREDETRRKLAKLVEVISGIPEQGTFGFIGDLGRLPKNLEELNDVNNTAARCLGSFNPSVPPVFHTGDPPPSGTTNHRGFVGMGWRGPYFKEMVFSDEHLKDAWGQTLRYTCPQTTRAAGVPSTGGVSMTVRTGQITSAGPDGVFDTADDINADLFFDNGNFFVTVNTATGVTGTLFYPANGEQTSQVQVPTVVISPPSIRIIFSSVPAGVRFLEVTQSGTPTKREFYHVALTAGIANRRTVTIP